MENIQPIQRRFVGEVVSNHMNKTIVVRIVKTVVHPKYGKRYVRSQTYQVHDPNNSASIGDTVSFVECRPISKHKRWRLVASS